MNFARRKSKAKGKKAAGAVAAAVARIEEPLPPVELLALPKRVSRMMPHLSQKFPILRDEDGQMLSLDQMEAHLTNQRETDQMTSEEVQSALLQYRLAAQADPASIPLPSSSTSSPNPAKSLSDIDASSEVSSESPDAFPDQSQPTTPPLPATAANYRRLNGSGNTLFGGRVKSRAEIKMAGSSSSNSLHSLVSKASSSGHEKTASGQRNGSVEGDRMSILTTATGSEGGDVNGDSVVHDRIDNAPAGEVLPDDEGKEEDLAANETVEVDADLALALSQLDEDDLDNTGVIESLLLRPSEEHHADEIKAVVPPSRQLSPFAPVFTFPTPAPTSSPTLKSPEPLESSAALPTVNSVETIFASSSLPTSTSNSTISCIPLPATTDSTTDPIPDDVNKSQYATSITSADVPVLVSSADASINDASPSASPLSPRAISFFTASESPTMPLTSTSDVFSFEGAAEDFPLVPTRVQSSEGPLDLSLQTLLQHDIADPSSLLSDDQPTDDASSPTRHTNESTAGSTVDDSSNGAPSSMFSPTNRESIASLVSSGSSYQSNSPLSDGEDRIILRSPTSAMDSTAGTDGDAMLFSDEKLNEATLVKDGDTPTSHEASMTLSTTPTIVDGRSAVVGEEDLALEDLVLIQETLVRSASRKAARKLGSSSPSLAALDNMLSTSDRSRSGSVTSPTPEPHLEEEANRHYGTIAFGVEDVDAHEMSDQGSGSDQILETTLDTVYDAPIFLSSTSMTAQTSVNSLGSGDSRFSPSSVGGDAFEWSSGLASSKEMPYNPLDLRRNAAAEKEIDEDGVYQEGLDEFLSADPSQFLGAPVQLNNPPTLRAPPAGMRRDNTANRMSTVVREVRNQANAATISLKKQEGPPMSPMHRVKKTKSVRNLSISQPTLVSAPDIPAVDITCYDVLPQSATNASGSGSGKNGGGFGLRFKMLLSKSKDAKISTNGDEVAPFVDFDTPMEPEVTPPFTPPSPAVQEFSSTSDYPQTPDYPHTPEGFVLPSSQLYLSPGLARVSETSLEPTASSSSGDPVRSLARLVSKLRRPGDKSDSRAQPLTHKRSISGPIMIASPSSASSSQRLPSSESTRSGGLTSTPSVLEEDEPMDMTGVGLQATASMRRRRADIDYSNMPSTAPLAVSRGRNPPNLVFDPSPPRIPRPSASAPLPLSRSTGSGRIGARDSIESMKKLWEAASDLGLPLDTVKELIDLSLVDSSPASLQQQQQQQGQQQDQVHQQRQRMQTPPATALPHIITPPRLNSIRSSPSKGRQPLSNSTLRPNFNNRKVTPAPAVVIPAPELPSIQEMSAGSYASKESSIPFASSPLNLQLPRASSPQLSFASRPSSGYAGSVFDLYGDADDLEEKRFSISESMKSRVTRERESSSESGAVMVAEREGDLVQLDSIEDEDRQLAELDDRTDLDVEVNDGEAGPTGKDEELWKAIGDLRKGNRDSVLFDNSQRFSTHSRHSSTDSSSTPTSDPFSLLVSRHRKDQSTLAGAMKKSERAAKLRRNYPSIYVRDEERLRALEGGVADQEFGRFIVRTGLDSATDDRTGGMGSSPTASVEQGQGSIDAWKKETGLHKSGGRSNMI